MDADLDLLLTTVFVTADDLLPERPKNARRSVTDAEVVTLCVAQAIMGIPSDRRFLAVAGKRLAHLFPKLPAQPGYFKRRRRLADTIEWLMGDLRQPEPRVLRRSAADRLDPGRVRAEPRDGQALRSLRTPPTTATAQPLPLLLGLPAARDLRSRRHPAGARAGLAQERRARGRPRAARPRATPRRRDAARRQGLRRPRLRRRGQPSSAPRSCARAAKTSPGEDRTSRRSANASSRSSGPAKTSSPSNATAPAPSPASGNASSPASSASPPPSPSTTNSAARAVHSSTTAPNRAESTI